MAVSDLRVVSSNYFPADLIDRREDLYYPDSDGMLMADNDLQYRCMVDLRFSIGRRYRHDPRVYVASNLLIYYVEGNAGMRVAPDVFVAFGVTKRTRRVYQMWVEGRAPDFALEIASPSTWRADLGWKKGLYQGLGIREYMLFDPTGEYFRPALQGFTLDQDVYVPMSALSESSRGIRGLWSATLQLEFWMQSNQNPLDPDDASWLLRLYDADTGDWLPTPDEIAEASEASQRRLAELEAELGRLKQTG